MSTRAKEPAADFQPLAPLVQSINDEKAAAARARLESLDRNAAITAFEKQFAARHRQAAYLVASHLVRRGIPPCFWRRHLSKSPDELAATQRFDLMVYDLLWLRRHHADQTGIISYGRYKDLFSFADSAFHSAAEYAFYQGRRAAWEIVRSMRLTESQQWECAWLRSAPIRKRAAATGAWRDQVFIALRDHLAATRRIKTFTDEDAKATLRRRHDIWLCSRMVKKPEPALIAPRYQQLTGEYLSRQIIARQLGIVRQVLAGMKRENEMETRGKAG